MSVSIIASDWTWAGARADDAGFRRSAAEAAIDPWAGPWSLAASRENTLPADEAIIKRSPVHSGNAPAPSAVPIVLCAYAVAVGHAASSGAPFTAASLRFR